MEKYLSRAFYAGILLFCFGPNVSQGAQFKLTAPQGRIEGVFELPRKGEQKGIPTYQLSLDGKTLITKSKMNLELLDSGEFKNLVVKKTSTRSSDSNYVLPFGKNLNVRDRFNEYTFILQEAEGDRRLLGIIFRFYDDGVGFRYFIPKQNSFTDFVIREELTQISLAENPKLSALPLNFSSAYESYYRRGTLDRFVHGQTLGLPFLLEYPGGQVVGVSEANLINYAGMYVLPSESNPNTTLETRLAPSLHDRDIKVKGTTPFATPWRVFIMGETPHNLIESNLIANLNEPSVIQDTSWIKPGKIQFPWWNGYILPKPEGNPDNKGGLNTWMLKRYIDFCAANKIDYHSIDGFDQAWYGGPVDPYGGSDITKSIPELDMPEILSYARKLGVKTRLWINGGALAHDLDRALDAYQSWGVEGIMVDFLNRDDQEMVGFYNEVLQKTAAHHLTVTFHGVYKPNGQSRTYPNLLNHEAVLGTEYDKWSETGSTPEHEVLIAYIRMMAGPLDTHQGSFRPISQKKYHMSYLAPRAIGTLARQLALYVVYENHLPMLADYPEAYEAQPQAFGFVKQVPVDWDETKLVAGTVGNFITVARRSGKDWYLGGITNEMGRQIKIPLHFLNKNQKYEAEIYADGNDPENKPEEVILKKINVSSKKVLTLNLAAAGGVAVKIRPLAP